MSKPRPGIDEAYANETNALSTSFALLLPRTPADVGPFLFEAAYALGEREAELARVLGVSRATLSGWKARGAIPQAHLRWFEAELAVAILSAKAPKQHEGFRHAGIELALALFEATSFDPFDLGLPKSADRVATCFDYLGGLSRLALFVMHRAPETLAPLDQNNVALLRSLVFDAAPRLRFRRVSQ